MWGHKDEKFDKSSFVKGMDGIKGGSGNDTLNITNDDWMDVYAAAPVEENKSEDVISFGESWLPKSDRVNSPSHYTSGKTEAIDIIEDAIKDAPSSVFGMLQGQVLKYLLRVWLKDNPLEDMKKARWYLDRLIAHYTDYPGDNPVPFHRD